VLSQLPFWPTAYLFVLGLSFYYFVLAGARTFEVNPGDETSSAIAQFSFLITGTIGTLVPNFGKPLPLGNAIAGALLLLAALSLYEWARHAIMDRRFHLAWTGDVPDTICDVGPYRHIRHPLYVSYILAFVAVAAAHPGPVSIAILIFNAGLFVHAAVTDERSLALSDVAAAYAEYKARTGMFVPRLGSH
jgi:protein-S-isoprenylcysteine O-methyltransferase Ste14